jgi:hypothetical protein
MQLGNSNVVTYSTLQYCTERYIYLPSTWVYFKGVWRRVWRFDYDPGNMQMLGRYTVDVQDTIVVYYI